MSYRACGILTHSGRDCLIPVPAGSPFNVCAKHIARIAEHIQQAEAIAGTRYRLSAHCPGCRLTNTLMANVHTQIATCQNCGHEMHGDRTSLVAQKFTPQPATRKREDVVYYIRFGDRVKIGTTGSLKSRLSALPHDEVLAVEPGGFELEQQRHREFGDLRITRRGEWFRLEEPLIGHMRQLRERTPWLLSRS